MKRVTITKYTKEKHKAAVEKNKAERKKRRYGLWDNLKYIISKGWQTDKLIIIMMLLEFVFLKGSEFAGMFAQKYIVNFALGENDRRTALVTAVILLTAATTLLGLYCIVYRYTGWSGAFRFVRRLEGELSQKHMNTDYANIEMTDNNDLLNKASTAAENIVFQMLSHIRKILGNLAALIALGGILAYLDPVLLVLVAVPCYTHYKLERHKMLWIWNMVDNWQKYDREIGYIDRCMSDLQHAKDVRIFRMPKFFKQLMARSLGHRLDWYEQQDEWTFRMETAAQAVNWGGYFLCYAYILYKVFGGGISAGDLILYFNAMLMLTRTMYDMFESYNGIIWQSENVSYFREYGDIADNTNRSKGVPLPTDDYEIELRNVSYTYYKADEPTIKNLSLTLRKGERLALVGLNGAGKTTLIKLMCGLYDPTEGEILLNGKPVNAYNRDEYFTLFSAVFQDTMELPASIAENISGVSYEQTDKEKLALCMKQAGLYEKIETLPNKERTHLDRSLYEDAIELSGGQKQKMSLAKALYKNAPILLLDEPTAALDPIAEQEMYLQYADFSKAKASVFISHRLASTRFCDRIILLDSGEIAECGTHDELISKGGKYAELFELQSSYYK